MGQLSSTVLALSFQLERLGGYWLVLGSSVGWSELILTAEQLKTTALLSAICAKRSDRLNISFKLVTRLTCGAASEFVYLLQSIHVTLPSIEDESPRRQQQSISLKRI